MSTNFLRSTKRSLLLLLLTIATLIGFYNLLYNEPTPTPKLNVHFLNDRANYCCNTTRHAECESHSITTTKNYLENLEYIDTETRIHFLETSGSPTLAWRQACSVESAARLNPNLNIQLYMVTSSINYTSPQLAQLLKYDNVKIEPLDIATYFDGTPFAPWLYCSQWKTGPYAISHLSDALRYLTLWKFGGYYFDLDVLFLRSVEKLRNFAALQTRKQVGAGAIHLRHKHPIIEEIAKRFVASYKMHDWAANGPGILNSVLVDVCKQQPQDIQDCHGFRVLAPESFYPIPWEFWFYYMQTRRRPMVERLTRKSFAIHVWNKSSKNFTIDTTSDQPYAEFAREVCPNIANQERFW